MNVHTLALYFLLWYFFTLVYNICSKNVFDTLPNHVSSITAMQLLIGIITFAIRWSMPSVKRRDDAIPDVNAIRMNIAIYTKIAACHCLGNIATNYSIGSGTISFVHIIKAAEPIFAAILNYMIYNISYPTTVYMTLIPIVFGVAVASATSMSFSWVSFITAFLSNVFYQMRIVFAKHEIKPTVTSSATSSATTSLSVGMNGADKRLSSSQLFQVITIISAILTIPFILILELKHMNFPPIDSNHHFYVNLVLSGISYTIYNEASFWILDMLDPISLAIGNTVKRLVIIFASCIILNTPLRFLTIVGAVIACGGTFLYSIAQNSANTGTCNGIINK